MGLASDLLGDELRHPLDVDLGTSLACAFRNRARHRLDMAIGRIVENQDFCHVSLLAECASGRADTPYGVSTRTSSESSIAVTLMTAASLMAAPSRASIRVPFTSTAPEAGTR
jgi:hypothetical protein